MGIYRKWKLYLFNKYIQILCYYLKKKGTFVSNEICNNKLLFSNRNCSQNVLRF